MAEKDQKVVQFVKHSPEEIEALQGVPRFNTCNHYYADMSHLHPITEVEDNADWMNTIVVKLPNGLHVTMCVMQSGKNESCIDVQYSDKNGVKPSTVMSMKDGKSETIKDMNLNAIICRVEGNK